MNERVIETGERENVKWKIIETKSGINNKRIMVRCPRCGKWGYLVKRFRNKFEISHGKDRCLFGVLSPYYDVFYSLHSKIRHGYGDYLITVDDFYLWLISSGYSRSYSLRSRKCLLSMLKKFGFNVTEDDINSFKNLSDCTKLYYIQTLRKFRQFIAEKIFGEVGQVL